MGWEWILLFVAIGIVLMAFPIVIMAVVIGATVGSLPWGKK